MSKQLLPGAIFGATFGAIFALSASIGWAQPSDELGLPFMTTYNSRDLGANASAWAIVEDNRGVLFAGLPQGLSEFDGERWKFFDTANQDYFRSFALGRDGVVYVGAVGELGYLAPDSLGNTTFVSMLDRVPEEDRKFDDVWHVFARDDGIFFMTATQIMQWTGSRMRIWKGAFHVGAVVHGQMYIREWGAGIKRLDGDSLIVVPGGERFADERVYVMVEYDETRMLVGTRTMGMFLYDGETFQPFRTEVDAFLRDSQIYLPGLRLRDGTFVIGTLAGGLVQIDRDGRLIRKLDRSTGLSDNTVTFLYQDRAGHLWLALNNGITRVDIESPFTIFDERLGITSGIASFARHEGTLYAAALGGIMRLDPASDRFVLVQGPVTPGLDLLSMRDVLVTAAMTSGVTQVRHGVNSVVKGAFGNEFVGNLVKRAHADTNLVFVGLRTGLGVLYYAGFGRWVDLGKTEDFGDVLAMVVTEDDDVWAAGNDGVHRIRIPWKQGGLVVDSAEVKLYGPDEGIPTAPYYDVVTIDGQVIAITSTNEALSYRPQDDAFAAYDGLPDIQLRGAPAVVVEDQARRTAYVNLGNGTLVGKYSAGAYSWDARPFLRFHEDVAADFMIDRDNVVWMAMPDGVFRFDPAVDAGRTEQIYPTLIRTVTVGEDSVLFAGWWSVASTTPVLAHDENALAFTYSLPGEDSDLTQHRTLLEGFDDAWSSWSGENRRVYTNLSAGSYTFRAVSRRADGTESAEASYPFVILPPWYMTWWAYGLYALVLAMGAFAVDRVQRRRLTKKEREESERREMELRTEAAEAESRALQAENERQKNVELLSEIGRDITATLSVKDIIDTAYENINALMDAAVFSIGILNEEENQLDFPATREKGESLPPYSIPLDDDNRLAVYCFKNREEVVVASWARDYKKYVQKRAAPVAGEDPASIIYLPLVHKDRTIGVITAQSFERDVYTDYHLNILRNLATYTAIALDNAEAYDRLNNTVADLNKAMSDLSTTQEQLVTQEKMASLGQLTAGIAHEIKNPLNFVNNFAELNAELASEVADLFEQHRRDIPGDLLQDLLPMLTSLSVNAQQIHKHGKRADSIIRNMMQHASGGQTERFPVEVNAFVDEYVNLSYHGMRAQVPSLSATIKRNFDKSAGNVVMAPQEIGRVIMNLVNNALYAVHEQAGLGLPDYEPTVTVATRRKGHTVEITVADNGPGIPENLKEKIFEPLFTTKPTGSGTGLGLSLSFDIVTTNHGGSLKVSDADGSGAEFKVTLPG